jgi:hypothetical protein
VLTHGGKVVGRFARPHVLRRETVLVEQFETEEGRVALVHVVCVQLKAECAQQADAAETEHKLLLHSVRLVAAIEIMRQRTILGAVLVEIGVQQQDRNPLPVGGDMNVQPGAYPHRTPRNFDCDHCVNRHAVCCRVPPVGRLGLLAIGIDLLAEVAGAADQRDEHDGNLKIGAGPHGIAGQHAEAAGIGVHLRPDGDLH